VLAVGELAARKDYGTLLRALATEPGRGLSLVIVGPLGYRGEHLPELAARLGVADRTDFMGLVNDAELARLYRDATALCMPSVIEGFGLPLVEAMSLALPIIASDIDVVREIAGDAALRVPVGDHHAFGEALAAVSYDATVRQRLSLAGASRSKLFSWKSTALQTIAVYEQAIECA
jgi:glycosyltransferase involved in cell wall biosynthesis